MYATSLGAGGLIHEVSTLERGTFELMGFLAASMRGGSSISVVVAVDVPYLQRTDAPMNARNCRLVSVTERMSPPAVETLRKSVGMIVATSRLRARASVTLVTA